MLGNLQPWGRAMFSGNIVRSLNYVLKDNLLTTSSRGGERKATKEEMDESIMRHAHKRTFVYKKMPQRNGRQRREHEHVVHAQLEVGNYEVCGSIVGQPWFNPGSGASPVRLNGLPHGFTPASLRSLCAMDKESLGKALHECLRPLGTGQGADRRAVPAPQTAPPVPHLGDRFSLKEEVLVHNTCSPDTTLAQETPEWWWLRDVTAKWVICRAITIWMRTQRQEGKDGVQSYPWERKCLSAGEFWEGKVLRVRLSSVSHGPPFPMVWRGFCATGRWSQPRTWPTLLLQGPGGAATRLL